MNNLEAIEARHTVRKYLPKTVPADVRDQLDRQVAMLNDVEGLSLEVRYDDEGAFGPLMRMVFAKGVRNYVVLAGPDDEGVDERIGRASAEVMVLAQKLGLNTWWVGGTFSRGKVSRDAHAEKVIGILAFGYGADQGKPHKSKSAEDVSEYDGDQPEWFRAGVRAALLAPTALNKQDFRIVGKGSTVTFEAGSGSFAGADAGIVKRHFEIGAGSGTFSWS